MPSISIDWGLRPPSNIGRAWPSSDYCQVPTTLSEAGRAWFLVPRGHGSSVSGGWAVSLPSLHHHSRRWTFVLFWKRGAGSSWLPNAGLQNQVIMGKTPKTNQKKNPLGPEPQNTHLSRATEGAKLKGVSIFSGCFLHSIITLEKHCLLFGL